MQKNMLSSFNDFMSIDAINNCLFKLHKRIRLHKEKNRHISETSQALMLQMNILESIWALMFQWTFLNLWIDVLVVIFYELHAFICSRILFYNLVNQHFHYPASDFWVCLVCSSSDPWLINLPSVQSGVFSSVTLKLKKDTIVTILFSIDLLVLMFFSSLHLVFSVSQSSQSLNKVVTLPVPLPIQQPTSSFEPTNSPMSSMSISNSANI